MPIYPEEKSSMNVKEFRIHCESLKLLLTLTMVAIVVIRTASRRGRQDKYLRCSALSVEKNRVRKYMLRNQSST